MAPGSRTWQIVQTVACGLALDEDSRPVITVCALEQEPRADGVAPLRFEIDTGVPCSGDSGTVRMEISYVPLGIDAFKKAGGGEFRGGPRPGTPVDAVVGCASVQPCATAAGFAAARKAPLWVDLFGDPITEIQSRAELHPDEKEANDAQYCHVWRLLMPALLQGDMFSALSTRQRFSVIGQLGVAGRLNRLTSGANIVATIPYGVFPSTDVASAPAPAKTNFIVMWCGSFNTWMDVDSFAAGFVRAIRENPRIRLLVVGGKIAGYNDVAYERFVETICAAGAEGAVRYLDWQPLEELRKLYAACDVGLSIDRFTYEAVLGSRTRLVNFLAAGKPVVSTVLTELSEDLASQGFLLPFEVGNSDSLAVALADASRRAGELAELGARAREYVTSRYHGRVAGAPLVEWIMNPAFAPDKDNERMPDSMNPLTAYWRKVLLESV
jgi:glycosyltransferase involved in cell wall biosynthesis